MGEDLPLMGPSTATPDSAKATAARARVVGPRKRVVFWVLMLVLVLAFIEGACLTVLALLESMGHAVPASFQLSSVHRREIGKILEKNEWYYGFSPTLGWTIIPAGRRLGYRANSQGIRGGEDYARIPPERYDSHRCLR